MYASHPWYHILCYIKKNPAIIEAVMIHKAPIALLVTAPPLGTLFVAAQPRYQDPISVNFPFCVNIAALGPTLDTSLRKDPK